MAAKGDEVKRNEAARVAATTPRQNVRVKKDTHIVAREYERGALVAGLLMALTVGMCMVHWAVC